MPSPLGAPRAIYTSRAGQRGNVGFNASLELAESGFAARLFDAAYSLAWPGATITRTESRHTKDQAQGGDVTITLADGAGLSIEEKFRPSRDGRDVAIEYLHKYDSGDKRRGWVHAYPAPEDGGPHWLAYGFGAAGKVLLLPWGQLREAYIAHHADWFAAAGRRHGGYRVIPARNDVGYTTYCLVVPTRDLLAAVPGATILAPEGEAK